MTSLQDFELDTMFQSVHHPIFIKDENLRFIFVNKAYERLFNIKLKQIFGKSVLELDYLPEEDRIFYQKEDTEMLLYGKAKHHIFDYVYKGKEVHTCLYWTAGFMQKNGMRGLIGTIVDINEQARMIQTLRKELQRVDSEKNEVAAQSRIDPLTQLYTRRTLDESLGQLVDSPGAGGSFACIMLDIDHFKQVNDTFGHATGDVVLREVAAAVRACARKRDVVCRYGGEEFVVLLPGGTQQNAMEVAERIRRRVARLVHTPHGQCVTVSAGCSEYAAGEAGMLTVQRADKALYTAKESGRNRVCASTESFYP